MLRGFGTLVLSLEICLCSPHLGFVPLLKKSSSTGVDSLLNSHSLHTPAGLFPCALSPRIYKSHAAFLLPLRGAGDPGLDSDKTGKNLCARSSSLTSSSRLLGRVRMASSGAVPGQAHRATGRQVGDCRKAGERARREGGDRVRGQRAGLQGDGHRVEQAHCRGAGRCEVIAERGGAGGRSRY
eukprot:894147-Rhodomonas_salina.2